MGEECLLWPGCVADSLDRVRWVWYRHRVIRVRAARQARAPGKAVRIRRDPVTVTGDETRECHWPSRQRAGKARGVGRAGSQETCPGAPPSTGPRGRIRVK